MATSSIDAKKSVRLPEQCVCTSLPGGEKLGYVYANQYGDGGFIAEQDRIFGEAFFCVCREAAAQQRKREFRQESSNIPPPPLVYGAWRFSDYQAKEAGQDEAKRAAVEWCTGQGDDYKPWLMLSGTVGTGKTHLACAAGWALLGEDFQVRYEYVPLLLDHLRDGYKDDTYYARAEQVRQAQVLILDDYNANRITDWAQEELLKIIHHRHERGAPLLVTTNVLPKDFESRVASRLADRWRSRVVLMLWESWRATEPDNKGGEVLSGA